LDTVIGDLLGDTIASRGFLLGDFPPKSIQASSRSLFIMLSFRTTQVFYLDSVQTDLQRLAPCLFVAHCLSPSYDELSGTGWAREGI